MTGFVNARLAAAAVMLLCGVEGASAGPIPIAAVASTGAPSIVAVQYGYGYPLYGYRRPYGYYGPYGGYRPYRGYRPYGYGPGPRFYGPGAAKERYTTRRNFCRNRPEQC